MKDKNVSSDVQSNTPYFVVYSEARWTGRGEESIILDKNKKKQEKKSRAYSVIMQQSKLDWSFGDSLI